MSTQKTASVSVALLHDEMVDKNNLKVTTSVTLIDVHDISRSCRTYGIDNFFIVHSSPTIRALVSRLKGHWDTGFGMTYNPNRTDALSLVRISETFEQVVQSLTEQHGTKPFIVATSARSDESRITFEAAKKALENIETPILIMFGTGWGMSPELLAKADAVIEPINGPTPYNHLSVRSAVAIVLDRLLGK